MEFNKSLKHYNTFNVNYLAHKYIPVNSLSELKKIMNNLTDKIFILGGGSNILLTKNIKIPCIHINIKGIKIIKEKLDSIIIEVNSGENWHNFVMWCISNNFGGIENLALIPGKIGGAPIQNIGAYGVELKDVFIKCKGINKITGKIKEFDSDECNFKYRDSIFKNELKNQYIITSIFLKLTKNNHKFNIDYGVLKNKIKSDKLNLKKIANAVIKIRQSKLPDPKKIGNAGSFFKNPIVSKKHFENLSKKFKNIPSYFVNEKSVKIPAAWMIEQIGFKGYKEKDAGIHKNQPLVLVNYGNANGKDILKIAKKVRTKIKEDFKIELETEVTIY